MSRIGRKPIVIPAGVKVTIADDSVSVEAKEKLTIAIPPLVSVAVNNDQIEVSRNDESRQSGAMQGLARSLINNMVIGVTEGYKKELQIIGVGFRAKLAGSKLNLSLGYSHPIEYIVPKGITLKLDGDTKIAITGADKQLVGEVAATIRRYRKPEPYKGKGIRYADEQVIIKEGKSVG
jgi:large subunit ribosomal protein L6